MRSPRIALKPAAARGLKAWAALEGKEPTAILEGLVMANLPAKVKELLGEPGGQGLHEPRSQGPKEPMSPGLLEPGSLGAREPGSLTDEARAALTFILAELEAGREPTSREAAEKVGLTPTGLGMALSKVGIKAQNTRRDLKAVKIYTRPMIGRIKELLDT